MFNMCGIEKASAVLLGYSSSEFCPFSLLSLLMKVGAVTLKKSTPDPEEYSLFAADVVMYIIFVLVLVFLKDGGNDG